MFFVCPSAHPGSSSIRCKALNPFCRQSMKTSDILMSPISGQEYPCATSTHQLIATIPNGPQRNKQRSRPPPRSAEGPASELRGPRESAARPRRTSQWPAAPRSVTAVTMVTMASALSTVVWIHSYITINIYIYYIYILYIYIIGYNWNLRLIQQRAYPGNTRSCSITTICWP